MILTKLNQNDISWEESPILAYSPNLNIIIIASNNGAFLKGPVIYSNNTEFTIGEYYEYWEKLYFYPFEEEVILKNKSK